MADVLDCLHQFILSTDEMGEFMNCSIDTVAPGDSPGTTSTDTGAAEAKTLEPPPSKRRRVGSSSAGDDDSDCAFFPISASAAAIFQAGAAAGAAQEGLPRQKSQAPTASENKWEVREDKEEPEVRECFAIPASAAAIFQAGAAAGAAHEGLTRKNSKAPRLDTSASALSATSIVAPEPETAALTELPPCGSGSTLALRGRDDDRCNECEKKAKALGIPEYLWPVEEHDGRVDALLIRCNLSEFRHKFHAEDIKFTDLRLLTDADLTGLGLKLGPRRRLLDIIQNIFKRKRMDSGDLDGSD